MASMAFVVKCPYCRAIWAGYDLERSYSEDIGDSVKMAARRGFDIGFQKSSITIGGCGCQEAEPTHPPTEPEYGRYEVRKDGRKRELQAMARQRKFSKAPPAPPRLEQLTAAGLFKLSTLLGVKHCRRTPNPLN